MGDYDNGVPSITAPWPAKDIVYVSIMGGVMIAAFLEWFLFLAAFLYCLVKVYQKAEHWTIKLLALLMMIVFTGLRCIFLPIMLVTLPLPAQITQYFPQTMVSFLQWFAFWSFSALLTIPWLFCIYQLVTNSLGRTKRIKHVLDDMSAPKTVVVMPCYKEDPDVLVTAINSVVDCDYPPQCLHVFLSFDGDQEDELYLKTIENLGVPLTLESYPKSIDVSYKNARVTVSRFPHGGKRKCQKSTFKLIDKIYTEYLKRNDNLFILFIDSDCILDKVCIQNFMYEMELKPGSKQNMLAMTGVITSTTTKNSLITLLQDMEYIHGQLFERSVESGCGAVTCLPGALTMLRFSAFRKMAKYYFADKAEQCDDLFDYGKCHLGEDRWLTHLFMIGAKERYQIQMCTGAFCKTEAVQTYRSLLKQRRRWFLGFITNEVCMLTDIRLWRRYPLLCVVRLMQNTIRTTALLFFIMILSLITTEQKISNLPVGFIAVSLGLNWVLMIYFGAKLKRFKIWLYPVMFVINPFFNWVYMVYGIFTAGQRTWGGPRADAGAADAQTSPQQAIEKAEATGDDLNVVPETFKPSVGVRHPDHPIGGPLLPPDRIEGRFAAAERLPGGWYEQNNDSGLTLPNMLPRNPNAPRIPLHPRASFDSFMTNDTNFNSVYMPRRVESFMGDEDQRKYAFAQLAQSDQGTELQRHPQQAFGRVYDIPDDVDGRGIPSPPSPNEIPALLRSGQSSPLYRPATPAGISSGPVASVAPTTQVESTAMDSSYHSSGAMRAPTTSVRSSAPAPCNVPQPESIELTTHPSVGALSEPQAPPSRSQRMPLLRDYSHTQDATTAPGARAPRQLLAYPNAGSAAHVGQETAYGRAAHAQAQVPAQRQPRSDELESAAHSAVPPLAPPLSLPHATGPSQYPRQADEGVTGEEQATNERSAARMSMESGRSGRRKLVKKNPEKR